jgi:hypothetical protein
MNGRRLPRNMQDGLVHIALGNGVLLVLTVETFVAGLQAGKMARRQARRARHQQRLQARAEAQTLAWIDTQGDP